MYIKFCGASKTVTGSCFLLSSGKQTSLIDCGMFQGPDVEHLNNEAFPFDPKEVDAVFLTHAHLDHCGLLPKLVKQGFTGTIYCSPPTLLLTRLILLDSAKVQEKNHFLNWSPLIYDTNDVYKTLEMLVAVEYDKEFSMSDLTITFRNASHILGASSIEISVQDKNVTFSGDLGRIEPRILPGYSTSYNPSPTHIISESLYGNTCHEEYTKIIRRMCNIFEQTFLRNGNVIIPVFALHRHQEILYILNTLIKQGLLERNVQIYSDTPLGKEVLGIYTSNNMYVSDEIINSSDPYGLTNHNLHFINKNSRSMAMRNKSRSIILAGGGMINGGRVMNHLVSFASDSKSTLLIVGFQAEGTLGNTIISRPKTIVLSGKEIPLNIHVEEIYGLSAHADKNDLLWWFNRYNTEQLKEIFLVHSEESQSASFKLHLEELKPAFHNKITIPSMNETYIL